jgi:osmotically inducible protein OsmC
MSTYIARVDWSAHSEPVGGRLRVGSQAFSVAVADQTRHGRLTNPQEIIGAALASWYASALSRRLEDFGHAPQQIRTAAAVDLEQQDGMPDRLRISLDALVVCPSLTPQTLQDLALRVARESALLKALTDPPTQVNAKLIEPGRLDRTDQSLSEPADGENME